MNDADKKKLQNAVSVVSSIQGQISNINGRGPNAVKAWALDIGRSTDDAFKLKLKNTVIAPLVKLLKDAKSVDKDLDVLYKEATDAKKLAAYLDGKAFRTKALTKFLASTKKFDADALKIQADLFNILGGGMYPSMGETDVKVTIDSITNFSKYYNALRIDLGKL